MNKLLELRIPLEESGLDKKHMMGISIVNKNGKLIRNTLELDIKLVASEEGRTAMDLL